MFGPHVTNLGRARTVSDRHVAYYRRRAAGGAGIVVTEEASVHGSDWPYERAPLATRCRPGWEAVAAACHPEGALVLAAIGHAGGQGSSAYNQLPLWAPSGVPAVDGREVPQWMEADDIALTVAGFSAATAIAVDSGLDGVEVNAGQHSLVRQFLSGLTNHREDGWGTDRLRFATEVLAAVRAAAGPAVVGLRLSCDELAPWAGITPSGAAGIVARLAPLVDYIVVVRGSIHSVSATRPDGHEEPGFNRGLTASMRAATMTTPLVLQGSIVDVEIAETALADGVCDAVEMTRAQIADPDLVGKHRLGRSARIRPCILCNQTCMVRDPRNPLVTCVVEPSAGHETEDEAVRGDGPAGREDRDGPGTAGGTDPRSGGEAPGRPQRRPHLLVVGAGPAGLETARVAALSGARVTVVEQGAGTGGMLRIAAAAAGRTRLARFADWLDHECRALAVTVITGRVADAHLLDDHDGPVVLATGSRATGPGYVVGNDGCVRTAAEVLGSPTTPGPLPRGDDEVVVWDPVGGPVAVSVAETLVAAGRRVTIVTPDHVVGTQLTRSGDLAPANARLLRLGVTIDKRSDLTAVGGGRVTIVERFSGRTTRRRAGLVVDCGPQTAEDRLWRSSGSTLPRAGDAVAPRTVHEAVLEGRRAAQAVVEGRPPQRGPDSDASATGRW